MQVDIPDERNAVLGEWDHVGRGYRHRDHPETRGLLRPPPEKENDERRGTEEKRRGAECRKRLNRVEQPSKRRHGVRCQREELWKLHQRDGERESHRDAPEHRFRDKV